MWSRSLLAKHVRQHAVQQGYPSLANAAKATIQRILSQHPVRPDKIAYYLANRDPEFEEKMKELLVVYNEVNMWNDASASGDIPPVITLSVDEKPGVQAIGNTAPDIMPNPLKNSRILRDHEYRRHGTVSILAALDLHNGKVIGQVHNRHRSSEFIELLTEIDQSYPPGHTIRLILDNHSAHISKETMNFLSTKPNRFVYVHTPKHGSWLNLVETLFGKMARTFLKNIRVNSIDELKERIMMGIAEINSEPVVHRWNKFEVERKY
jgi:transposase